MIEVVTRVTAKLRANPVQIVLTSMAPRAFFQDREDEREALLQALRELYGLARTREIVFPSAGLGTGLAQMGERSPQLYRLMTSILREHVGFEQPAS